MSVYRPLFVEVPVPPRRLGVFWDQHYACLDALHRAFRNYYAPVPPSQRSVSVRPQGSPRTGEVRFLGDGPWGSR